MRRYSPRSLPRFTCRDAVAEMELPRCHRTGTHAVVAEPELPHWTPRLKRRIFMCSFGVLATRAPRAGSGAAADGAARLDGAELVEHLLMDTSLEEEGLLATTFAILLDDRGQVRERDIAHRDGMLLHAPAARLSRAARPRARRERRRAALTPARARAQFCGLHKPGGAPLSNELLERAIGAAQQRLPTLVAACEPKAESVAESVHGAREAVKRAADDAVGAEARKAPKARGSRAR